MNLTTTVLLLAVLGTTPVLAADKPTAKENPTDNMQILRDKIKADKKLFVTVNMQLTESEAKVFWPVYDTYQKELQQINTRMGKTIRDYADAYNKGVVPDDTAKKLIEEAVAAEEAEVKLKRAYLPKFQKVLPGAKAARYVQIENKIRAAIKYEMAAGIPLVR